MAMEEIKERCVLNDGKEITSYKYSFSKIEREHLTFLLQNHDKNTIEFFIDQLERDFSLMHYTVFEWNQGTKADQVKKLLNMISKLDLALKDVYDISSGRFFPLPFRKCITQDDAMENNDPEENRRLKINEEARSKAETIREPLQRLVEVLMSAIEIEKLKKGMRRRADELNLAFVIAKEFITYIGVPRPHTGPFISVVDYCFEIIENKQGDHTRAIRQALKKLSYSCPARVI